MHVMVTGASGCVGGHLCRGLIGAGHRVTAVTRRDGVDSLPAAVTEINVGDIGADTDWRAALAGIDAVIHTAARTHVLSENGADAEDLYRRLNVDGTRRLAEAAAEAGTGRFLFLSSIKAGGENTVPGQPLKADDPAAPEDAYGRTKRDAEAVLRQIAERTDMSAVALRPPLIYGAGIKGNLLTLFKAVDKGLPLPLGTVQNKRSLVYVGNLVDVMIRLLDAPAGDFEIFHVTDGEDVSTPVLIERIASALGRPARLFAFPESLLVAAARLTGRTATVRRIAGSLQVDDRTLRRALNWHPPHTMKEGWEQTAAWYKSRERA